MTHRINLSLDIGANLVGKTRAGYIRPLDNGRRGLYAMDYLGLVELEVNGRSRQSDLFGIATPGGSVVAIDRKVNPGDTSMLMERVQFDEAFDSLPKRALRPEDLFVRPGEAPPKGLSPGRIRFADAAPDWTSRHCIKIDRVEVVRFSSLTDDFALGCGYLPSGNVSALGFLSLDWYSFYAGNDNTSSNNPWVLLVEGELGACE